MREREREGEEEGTRNKVADTNLAKSVANKLCKRLKPTASGHFQMAAHKSVQQGQGEGRERGVTSFVELCECIKQRN